MKCVCSDCGHELDVEQVEGECNPSTCGNCNGKIISVGHTTTSNDEVAWVEPTEE